MHIDEFRQYLLDNRSQYLFHLIALCRKSYLDAARLLEIHSDKVSHLKAFHRIQPISLTPLYEPFSVLVERYINVFFTPQTGFFEEDSQADKWDRYFFDTLLVQFSGEYGVHMHLSNRIIRNILIAVQAFPDENPENAKAGLIEDFNNMTLPEMPGTPSGFPASKEKMSEAEFRQQAQEEWIYLAQYLFASCRDRYRDAAQLLGISLDGVGTVGDFSARHDLGPLAGGLFTFLERYIAEFFTQQLSLPNLSYSPVSTWGRYFFHIFIPILLENEEEIRNVLRAVHALPSKYPKEAKHSLVHYFAEVTLPEVPADLLYSSARRT